MSSSYKLSVVSFLEIPSEILLKIIKQFEPDSKDLQNLRLTCRLLNALATGHMFTKVSLPRNLDDLTISAETLSQERIGKHIREIKIRAVSVAPREYLCLYNNSEFGLLAPPRLDLDMLPRWTAVFAVNIFRIFMACRENLRILKIYGIIPENHGTSTMRVEEAFVGSIVECCATLHFSAFNELYFEFKDMVPLSALWDRSTSITSATLEKTLSSVRKLAYHGTARWEDESVKDTDKFLSVVMNLDLRSFKLCLGEYHCFPATLAPLGVISELATLELSYIKVVDNLTRVLMKMRGLRSIALERIYLDPGKDRWSKVFGVILESTAIEEVHFDEMFYKGIELECDGSFCVPYLADLNVYRQVLTLVKELKAKCPSSSSFCTSVCDGACWPKVPYRDD